MQSNLKKYLLASILFMIAYISVGQKKFSLIPSAQSGVAFRNDIVEDDKLFYYVYEYLYLGAGVAVGDINNDGLTDIYFSSTRGYNKLYLNKGNFTFEDITNTAGVNGGEGIKTGVNMVDVNSDGLLDIVVCKSGYKNISLLNKMVYINNGNLTFTNKATELGLENSGFTIQSYFFDYDNDGDKDAYFINHNIDFSTSMNIPAKIVNNKLVYIEDTSTQWISSRIFENKGGKFFDVTKKAGLLTNTFCLSASISDVNDDGYPDIFLANDFMKPDYWYINNKNGTFTNKLSEKLNHISFSSMGTDMADINNDGLQDLFVADMAVEEPKRQKQLFALNQNYDKFHLMLKLKLYYQYPHNMLHLNNGNGTYSDIAYHADIAETEWSWSPLIADFDNDGWKDIYITNGLKRDITDWDYKVFVLDSVINTMNKGNSVNLNTWLGSIPQVKTKNYLYRNSNTLRFQNFTDVWMDAPPTFSSGAAYADLDNDGDLDLIINNVDDEAHLYKNNHNESLINNWLKVKCFADKTNTKELYGVKIKIVDDENNLQLQEYNPQRGFMSTLEHNVHFGLGTKKNIKRLEAIFPSKKQITLDNIAANQTINLYEIDAKPITTSVINNSKMFSTTKSSLTYTHTENDYIDFKREPLLPYKNSRKGPYYAKADVNGDKLEDIFIGGSAGTSGKLFLQNALGAFIENKQPIFEKDKLLEDNGTLFFDADADGDNDLYVVSGGAEFEKGSTKYQDRLYINNGKGLFTKATNALPAENSNGTCVLQFDYDSDGDLDLFIGGGVLPGKFPQADESIILQNNKGVFTNITKLVSNDIAKLGIINTATWADADGDKQNDLIITGEWMGTSIFTYKQNKFEKLNATVTVKQNNVDTTFTLPNLKGWFNVVKPADVDNDGDIDFILGNRGTNSKIECGITKPATIYAKDFDGNGSYDAVLGYYIFDKCYPMYSRDQLIDQMPMFRKKYTRYHQYSGKTMDEIFTTEQKQGMDIYTANCFESGILYNNGNSNFTYTPFTEKAQLSTINDFVINDFDKDGLMDILVCGNNYDADVSTGNYDATAALLLKGNGKGNFATVDYNTTGLNVKGEIRKMIYLADKKQIIFLQNNGAVQSVSY